MSVNSWREMVNSLRSTPTVSTKKWKNYRDKCLLFV